MLKANPSLQLEIYQELFDLSSQIVMHLREQHWNRAACLCATYEQTLEKMQSQPALSHQEKRQRRALLNQILANDAEMRSLMSPQTDMLLTMAQSTPVHQQHRSSPLFN